MREEASQEFHIRILCPTPTTHTPLFKGVEAHPLNRGDALKTLQNKCFGTVRPLNEGGEAPPPYLRLYGLSGYVTRRLLFLGFLRFV